MSYLVLARKYRPRTFEDVIGQEHITNSLKKAIENGRVHHAYLFCGPRGIGKTTCARILARDLNQQDSQSESLELDSSLDIIEIDGASNRGIDEIRTLRENVKFVPMSGRYKVYIVDEVHMLTTEAFNALLKTLEEPPEHVKFIFATTDPNKLPMTVVSRCQQFTFKRISLETISNKLKDICVKEGFKAEDEALFSIAKAAQGSMRDALSILDQLISFCDGTVRVSDVTSMLGTVDTQMIFDLTDHIANNDCQAAILKLEIILGGGRDAKQLNQNLVEHFRHLMIMKIGGEKLQSLIDYPKVYKEALFIQAGKYTIQRILKGIETFINVQDTARIIESFRTALEFGLAKLICQETKETASVAPVTARPVLNAAKPANAMPNIEAGKSVVNSPSKPATTTATTTPTNQPKPNPNILKNNKGSMTVGELSSTKLDTLPFTLDDVRNRWNELTFAVSQETISVGTYLMEGFPIKLTGNKLTIGFTPEHAFHKECLDTPENLKTIGNVTSKVLGVHVLIEFVVDATALRGPSTSIDDAVKMFKGEVVNEWHSDKQNP